MTKQPKGNRSGRLNISLTEDERRTLDRRVADESARLGRPLSLSEYVRMRTIEPALPSAA